MPAPPKMSELSPTPQEYIGDSDGSVAGAPEVAVYVGDIPQNIAETAGNVIDNSGIVGTVSDISPTPPEVSTTVSEGVGHSSKSIGATFDTLGGVARTPRLSAILPGVSPESRKSRQPPDVVQSVDNTAEVSQSPLEGAQSVDNSRGIVNPSPNPNTFFGALLHVCMSFIVLCGERMPSMAHT